MNTVAVVSMQLTTTGRVKAILRVYSGSVETAAIQCYGPDPLLARASAFRFSRKKYGVTPHLDRDATKVFQ